MKAKRHAKILEIIHTHPIATQEELIARLAASGFAVTQATISRDIKELRLIKTMGSDGGYYYATIEPKDDHISSRFDTLFTDVVTSIDYAGNIVVVKCLMGTANAACAAMDSLRRSDIVGTISGDDTFLCIMKDEHQSVDLVMELKKRLRHR